MPVVKSLKLKKKTSCCIVTFAGIEEELLISTDLAVKFGLSRGTVLSDEEVGEITAAQKITECKQAAYNFCAYKPRTEYRLKQRLAQKGFDEGAIQESVSFVKDFNLIDDARFARGHIERVISRKPAGRNKIIADLRRAGIAKETILEALASRYGEENDLLSAQAATEKKLRMLKHKDPAKQKSALYSYLVRQGFAPATIKEMIRLSFPES